MAQRFIVTGGAGFVGSHMVDLLVAGGADVVVVDDLRQGHPAALPREVELIAADIGDRAAMREVLARGPWDGVFHFAALSLVGESMKDPFCYLRENACGGFNLIEMCAKAGVPRFILSSTANLFGEPERMPITEDEPLKPSSPYGESKLMLERALHWSGQRYGMRYASLRYFNAAGADPAGRIGEAHDPETHLIPLVIDATLSRRPPLTVFGTDYATPDGTCIRDYVHVSDLCRAHVDVLPLLKDRNVTFNVGTGIGHSIFEVVEAVQQVTGRTVPFEFGDRRPGDPPHLVCSRHQIERAAGWSPSFGDLESIVRTAYDWRLRHPAGYG